MAGMVNNLFLGFGLSLVLPLALLIIISIFYAVIFSKRFSTSKITTGNCSQIRF